MENSEAWQLKMFKKTLKKRLRLKNLKKILGRDLQGKKCLLVTCGDNNGAMNYYLRELGGEWSWADLETKSLREMEELLGEEVKHVQQDRLPYADNTFDCIVSIDVHEHLEEPYTFTKELARIVKPLGRVIITVPGGQKTKIVNMMKNFVGMTKEKYGHFHEGYSVSQIKEIMLKSNLQPDGHRTFSHFFTELIELGINFLYVNVLSKKGEREVEEGTIAPATQDQLKSVEKSYKLYSLVFPIFWLITRLDYLLFFTRGYVTIVEGKKP
ncbi:MAG: hypothetical protein Kow0042_30320 [Calditrichia bacterium]